MSLANDLVAVDDNRALAVEMGGCRESVWHRECRNNFRVTAQGAGELMGGGVAVANKAYAIPGEQRSLLFRQPAIGAMSAGIDEFTDGYAVSRFARQGCRESEGVYCESSKGYGMWFSCVAGFDLAVGIAAAPVAANGAAMNCRRPL